MSFTMGSVGQKAVAAVVEVTRLREIVALTWCLHWYRKR